MPGYCTECGQRLLGTGTCVDGHSQLELATVTAAGGRLGHRSFTLRRPVGAPEEQLTLPKARPVPRLAASGIEFMIYVVALWAVLVLSALTGLVAGIVLPLLLCAVVAIRDLRGGMYSLSKRLAGLRLVDAKTGLAASNAQGFARNSYFIVLLLLMALPAVEFFAAVPFKMLVVIDGLLVMVNPAGRRLGDFLAGTQVVSVRR